MAEGFDWGLITTRQWTQLSRFAGLTPRHVVDGLYAVAGCVYAMTNEAYGTVEDPGVGAFLWTRSASVAWLIYERRLFDDANEELWCPRPPADAVGFAPTTFAAALAHLQRRRPRQRVDELYDFFTGAFLHTSLASRERTFYYRSYSPPPDEEAMAIDFSLPD
jgi:hypothetical protein